MTALEKRERVGRGRVEEKKERGQQGEKRAKETMDTLK